LKHEYGGDLCSDKFGELYSFQWDNNDYYWNLMKKEEEVGTKVTFNSDDFNKYLQANLKQNCKYNYIPKAEANYVTDKHLQRAIYELRVRQDFENKGTKYSLDFEGRGLGRRGDFNYNPETKSGSSSMTYAFYIIYTAETMTEARTENFNV
jgi:hypothetical protein